MTFEELFLTKEEQERWELEQLEKKFILSDEEMLQLYEKEAINAVAIAKLAIEAYLNYKLLYKRKKGV